MTSRTPSTRAVWLIGAGVVAAGVAAIVAINAWSQTGAPGSVAAGSATTAVSQDAGDGGPGSAGTPTSGPGPAGDPSSWATPGSSAALSSPATAGPAPTAASELAPDASNQRPTQPPPQVPSPTTSHGPSLTGPLPPAAAARGEQLVAGFPSQVVPVLDGIRVVSTSVTGEGYRLQIGLEASSDAAPAAVTSTYSSTFVAAGFTPGESPAVSGSTATWFIRGPDGLVLTVRDRVGGGSELSISGTLTTAG